MNLQIDKTKALAKWSPILESLGVKKHETPRKAGLMAVFAEYYQLYYETIPPIASPQVGTIAPQPWHNPFANTPPVPNLLPMNMYILSRLDIENKGIYFTGLNDDKLVLRDGPPKFKIKISITREFDDIKLERRAKLQNIVSSPNIISISGMDIVDRYEKLIKNMIISDISDRLHDGGLLYIDKSIIERFSLVAGGKLEAITRYEVL